MARKRSTRESKAEAHQFWQERRERDMRERSKAQAEYAVRERAAREAEERKTAIHMARSPKTRAAEAQLLGERIGAKAAVEFWPDEEQAACIRRSCLSAQREALRTAKEQMRRMPSEYVGMREPADDLERRAFLRGAWWSIKRRLAPICQPEVAEEQEGLFGLGKRRR